MAQQALSYRYISMDVGLMDELALPTVDRLPDDSELPMAEAVAAPPPRKTLHMAASYLRRAFEDPQHLADDLQAATRHRVAYDCLVGMGLSGALVIPAVARLLDKHWLIIRKPDDGSHSLEQAEGTLGQRWLFVDDLIDSGRTFKRVRTAVERIASGSWPRFETRFAGAYLYNGRGELRRPADMPARCQ